MILAVCSKNTESIAREVFEKHPEMVLRLDDVSCFMANWDDKATNLGRIAEQLNIGLNSLVFVDDNPAERSIVRRLRAEVAVPEMPEESGRLHPALERHRYFQAVAVSTEDLKRTELLSGRRARGGPWSPRRRTSRASCNRSAWSRGSGRSGPPRWNVASS